MINPLITTGAVMQKNNPLKNKRVALLGGQGARPEAKDNLVAELELASLEWVYAEKGKTKEYTNFFDSFRPGKFDYVFVLTKFISHKVWDMLKVANLGDTTLVRINGSYNAENFVNALFEQTSIKPELPVEQAPVQQVTWKTLEPAKAHDMPPPPVQDHGPAPELNQELIHWRNVFGAPTPEKAKAKVDARIAALEARVAQLSATQRDEDLIKAAHRYHRAIEEFLQGIPVTHIVEKTGEHFVKALKRNGVDFEKPIPNWVPSDKEFQNVVMRTNLMLGKMFSDAIGMLKTLSSEAVYDNYNACRHCKRNKSIGHHHNCPVLGLKRSIDLLEADMKKADPFAGPPKRSLMEKIVEGVKGK
jgi:hypothetical protein